MSMTTISAIEILTHERLELTFEPCPECSLPHTLTVRKDEFEHWLMGTLITNAFPGLLPEQLEAILQTTRA